MSYWNRCAWLTVQLFKLLQCLRILAIKLFKLLQWDSYNKAIFKLLQCLRIPTITLKWPFWGLKCSEGSFCSATYYPLLQLFLANRVFNSRLGYPIHFHLFSICVSHYFTLISHFFFLEDPVVPFRISRL